MNDPYFQCYHVQPEAHLGPCRTSVIEVSCENSQIALAMIAIALCLHRN